jgi:hypothetical protein
MSDSEHNFQDLKRLLKLKRHEVPPPGYFNNFSSQVISRIRAGEDGTFSVSLEKSPGMAPWLHTLLHLFDARPGLIGGLATSACLLVVFGIVLGQHSDSPDAMTGSTASTTTPQLFASSTPVPVTSTAAPLSDPMGSSGITLSTNPVTSLQPVATLFGQPANSTLFQPAGFNASGN